MHLNNKMLDVQLLLKDYTIVIIWTETVGVESGEVREIAVPMESYH